MATADAFLRDIASNPGDDAPRLVYADWLDEHGEPRRAEFIRLQCRLAALDEAAAERPELLDREWELLTVYRARWQPGEGSPLEKHLWKSGFIRGFFARVGAPAAVLLAHGDELFRSYPLEELRIHDLGQTLPEVAQQPWLAHVSSLDLSANALTVADLQALLGSPHLGRLTRLTLRNAALGPEALDLLASWPGLRRLTQLDLGNANLGREGRSLDNNLGPGWVRRLLGSPHLGALTTLSLQGSDQPDADAAFVANCPRLDSVTHLSAVNCGLTADGVRALAEARGLPALRRLSVGWNSFGDEGNALLAASPLLARLDTLDVNSTQFGARAAAALAASPHLGRLRRLDLTQCRVGPEEARAVASAQFGALAELRLFSDPIGAEGMAALARSPHLAGLRLLDLTQCYTGPNGAKALAASPHLAGLRWLNLASNKFGMDEAKLLAGTPGLARLRQLGLANNDFGARGCRVIMESPHLSGLWGLDLASNNFTDKTARQVAASTTLAELRRLILGGLYSWRHLTDEGDRVLAASPRLPRLLQLHRNAHLSELGGPVSPVLLEHGKGHELWPGYS
jgi:uncharacterized protein (TIGR02996 family)